MIISVFTGKGGAGKTLISHTISRAMAMQGKTVFLGITDQAENVQSPINRGYTVWDAKTDKGFGVLIDLAVEKPEYVIVLDGGGNKSGHDKVLYDAALASDGIALIPFMPDRNDWTRLKLDADAFPNAWLLPNRMPTNTLAKKKAEDLMAADLSNYTHRILDAVPDIRSLPVLLWDPIPAIPSKTDNAVRAIGRTISELMKD